MKGNNVSIHMWSSIVLAIGDKLSGSKQCILLLPLLLPWLYYIGVESAVVIGTRKHFEVTNLYKLFLS